MQYFRFLIGIFIFGGGAVNGDAVGSIPEGSFSIENYCFLCNKIISCEQNERVELVDRTRFLKSINNITHEHTRTPCHISPAIQHIHMH